MIITVQVRPELAWALQQPNLEGSGGHARELVELVRRSGGQLEPLHPGATEPELASFFAVDIADPLQAEQVSEKLRQHPAVLAAYIKPAAELP